MKKSIVIFLIISIHLNSKAQLESSTLNSQDYEKQILTYEPAKRDSVSTKQYEKGVLILRNTKDAVENNPENFNSTDYFNILSAFLTLKESDLNLNLAFKKLKESENSCYVFINYEPLIKDIPKWKRIINDFSDFSLKCKAKKEQKREFNIQEYCEVNTLNLELVKKIESISKNDKLYRKSMDLYKRELKNQSLLDKANQSLIDSLYKEHQKYVGKSLVGNKFKHVMWIVVQHSNIEMMERYIPIIQKAVSDDELGLTPFKMLLDRYYGLKHGYQIFGSQQGFNFETADEMMKKKIMEKYNIMK